jgi:hypothetical protein
MKTFKDTAGREWAIAINVTSIKRVRDLLKVDLLDIVEGKLIERLIADPVLLCDVIYVVCKSDVDAQGISDEDFGRAMAGNAIEHATKALLEDLADFSPSPRDRANLAKVIETTWKLMDRARDLIESRLSSGEIEQAAERALASAGNSFGSALAFSASTQDG